MKKLFLPLIFVCVLTHTTLAQNVAINATGAVPVASAMLDITSTTSGLLIPRMSSAQRIAIATPATGLVVYDTTTGTFWYFDGTFWVELLNGSTGWRITGNALSSAGIFGSTTAQDVRFFSNNTERMRLVSSGVFGINTAAPATSGSGLSAVDKLNITTSTTSGNAAMVELYNTSASGFSQFANNSGSANPFDAIRSVINYPTNSGLPAAVYGLQVANSGFGIGVNAITNSTNANSNGIYAQCPFSNSAGYYAGYFVGRVASTGNYFVVSDKRLKKNITPLGNCLDKVIKMMPVEYNFDEKYKGFIASEEKQAGLLAQDVDEIFHNSNIVSDINLKSVGGENEPKFVGATEKTELKTMAAKAVSYSALTPYLIGAIKEQQQQIELLKQEIELLKSKK